jgi:hypothetical protein
MLNLAACRQNRVLLIFGRHTATGRGAFPRAVARVRRFLDREDAAVHRGSAGYLSASACQAVLPLANSKLTRLGTLTPGCHLSVNRRPPAGITSLCEVSVRARTKRPS